MKSFVRGALLTAGVVALSLSAHTAMAQRSENPGGGMFRNENPGGGMYKKSAQRSENPGGGMYRNENPGGGMYKKSKKKKAKSDSFAAQGHSVGRAVGPGPVAPGFFHVPRSARGGSIFPFDLACLARWSRVRNCRPGEDDPQQKFAPNRHARITAMSAMGLGRVKTCGQRH